MPRIILYIILAYLAYQFVFKFLLPVMRASRQVKDQMRDFQSRMEGQHQQQNTPPPKPENKKKAGDYIDYEEIK